MKVLPSVTPTAEQLKVIVDDSGFAVIRGAAGSGKTTTAILRLKFLIRKWINHNKRMSIEAPIHVLVLTYNRPLRGYISELVDEQIKDIREIKLEVKTFAKWAFDKLRRPPILDDAIRRSFLTPLFSRFKQEDKFLYDELEYALGRFMPEDLSNYLDCERTGRGSSPKWDKSLRHQFMEEVITPYSAWKRRNKVFDFNDLAVQLVKTSVPPKYQVILVDEAQDFSANECRAVLNHTDTSHSITFILDGAQRIYPKGFIWKEIGVKIRPNQIRTLQHNYRNTKQIASFVKPILEGVDIGGEDGAIPNLDSCDNDGPLPILLQGAYQHQVNWVLKHYLPKVDLRQESIAFLKPLGGKWFDTLKSSLNKAKFPFEEITKESEWPTGDVNIALSTMHSSKGLEFDHVIILGLNQQVTPHGDESGDVSFESVRRLFAMACARARKGLVVGYKPSEASSLIRLLTKGTYKETTV